MEIAVLKFIYSEKATKFCEISTVDLTVFFHNNGSLKQNIAEMS